MRTVIILLSFVFLFSGCSTEKRPFTTKYTSKDSVEVTYQGKAYHLNRLAPAIKTPFSYEFEADGDLNLVVNGKSYEIDSPYDVDKKKKKKTRKTSSKKSSKRKK
ncbi:MAG: hypothetical protein ABFS19_07735 [Thermodesulfobacteriota bacterium]